MLERIGKMMTRAVPGPVRRGLSGRATGDFSLQEREIVLQIARVAMPSGDVIPSPDAASIDRYVLRFKSLPASARAALRGTIWTLEMACIARYGQRFTRLEADKQLAWLQWFGERSAPSRLALQGLLAPLRVAHYGAPDRFEALGCNIRVSTPERLERQRWRQNALELSDLDPDTELEADVVIIGTGAGGAVVAKELAERGLAVAMVEEGRYFDRRHFDGDAFERMAEMYHGGGVAFSLGNTPILIPTGRTVGGSTTINSGTCFRVPDQVLEQWQSEFGLTEFEPETMAPFFERVEEIIGVEPADEAVLGGCARVIRRGCEALGLTRHGGLHRNAPGCDGQGLCCFGCPTDAKRSTNISYVPLALQKHATLISEARVSEILRSGGRAVGIRAETPRWAQHQGKTHQRLVIRAKAVVVSCGTFGTPSLLLKQGLANESGALGRHLSLHPATGVLADFDEYVDGMRGIPQGYYVADFSDRGIMYEGATTPPELTSASIPFVGRRCTEIMERYQHLAAFGFMIQDTSRGRVRPGSNGQPRVSYNINSTDMAKVHEGLIRLAEIYFAAGARSVFLPVHRFDELHNMRDLRRFREAKLRPLDVTLTGFHPLGTARLGKDPKTSVVGPDHACHDVPGLYIVDGSSVPSSLGVNPQVTIMAMATRAAGILAERVG